MAYRLRKARTFGGQGTGIKVAARQATEEDSGAAFAEQLLALLDEGSFATTYKFAVLLALLDSCLEQAGADGRPPATLEPVVLARRVLTLYWPHAVPYPGARTPVVLRQSNTGQAEIVSAIRTFRAASNLPVGATVAEAARLDPDGFNRVVADIEWKLVEMPLPRLQRSNGTVTPFLYVVHWDERIRRRGYRSGDIDTRVHLTPAARQHLIRFAGLIRPLIQRMWSDRVARYNDSIFPDRHLDDFLFGADRLSLVRVRTALAELQDGRCFYTGEPLGTLEVDHFLPWARFPNNAIENLVVTNRKVNGMKRAHLVAPQHLLRWGQRNHDQRDDLDQVARAASWESRPVETVGVVRSVYLSLRDGSPLWDHDRSFVDARHADLVAALSPAL